MRFQITHDMVLQKIGNGVQLTNSLQKINQNTVKMNIQSIFSLPCNVFMMLNDDVFLSANEVQVKDVDMEYHEFIGKPISYFIDKSMSLTILKNNKEVIRQGKMAFLNESIIYKHDGIYQEAFSIKLPLYDKHKKTIGLLGFGIKLQENNLAFCISKLQQFGIFNDSHSTFLSSASLRIDGINLTIRESECIKLIIRGKTAKEIASLLGISNRTVEYYLENIKFKLKVNTKGELIDKVINQIL